ncbi:MAG: aldehyde dehydrogenase family protein [Acidimicrobiales bacterium]|nr:aldehyde dehydrogenase family protein [Acidimicrobiales bacterium]
MGDVAALTSLEEGMLVPFGGDRSTRVSAQLAAAFRPGDHLVVDQSSGALLHVPAADVEAARVAVDRAHRAFTALRDTPDDAISDFFRHLAGNLADPRRLEPVHEANRADVASARERGRATNRLELSERMQADMVDGIRGWAARPPTDPVVDTTPHDGWYVERVRAPLGVVGFVFEGRPNVLVDAVGLIRTRNTAVFRIGSDALRTARALVTHVLDPALDAAGLPAGAAALVDATSRAAGYALFSDARLALAVARGSGPATAQLGTVARQAGIPASLHGTGGAWLVADSTARREVLAAAVEHSLDRKVCNTLNVCCIPRDRADDLVPAFLDALSAAARRRDVAPKLHITAGDEAAVPAGWWDPVTVTRPGGPVVEPQAEPIAEQDLGCEWEWDGSPEVTLCLVDSLDHAVQLYNRYSPRLVASLVSEDARTHDRFFATVEAPFVGNGMTRWVDGQYAFGRPELGLSNWEAGRTFARGAVLSGDDVFTIRARAVQLDPNLHR